MDAKQAVKNIKAQKAKKFDETIELTISVAQKSAEGSFRMDLNIPNQFGESKKVLVLCDKSEADGATGADFIGLEEYVEKIKGGWKEFDVVIATPTVMPKIAVLGKFLGSSGLMPNPKNGTVTKDLQKSINEFKSGKVTVKSNKTGQIQLTVGKRSMDDEKLLENIDYAVKAVIQSVGTNNAVKSVVIKSSMGAPYRLI